MTPERKPTIAFTLKMPSSPVNKEESIFVQFVGHNCCRNADLCIGCVVLILVAMTPEKNCQSATFMRWHDILTCTLSVKSEWRTARGGEKTFFLATCTKKKYREEVQVST